MPNSPPDLVGEVLLSKFQVLRRLGGGGMGVVYEVKHLMTGHRRALKVVLPEFVTRPRYLKRLIREASVAGTLQTPLVVETYDAGHLDDGSAYILMELLDGQSLLQLMQSRETIPVSRLIDIVSQVCEGLDVAHAAGIVHRDLKPENLFLVRDGEGRERVKILDFGISKFSQELADNPARLTKEGTILGTPYYMSAEQASGREVDGRTDIYALGVIMYEILAGRLPFEAKNLAALFMSIHTGECLPLKHFAPEVDPGLCLVVHQAMHNKVDLRFQTPLELRRALVPFAASDTVKRGKTISDGARATVDFADTNIVPPAPRMPTIDGSLGTPGASLSDSGELLPDSVGSREAATIAASDHPLETDDETPEENPEREHISEEALAAWEGASRPPKPALLGVRRPLVLGLLILLATAAVVVGVAVPDGDGSTDNPATHSAESAEPAVTPTDTPPAAAEPETAPPPNLATVIEPSTAGTPEAPVVPDAGAPEPERGADRERPRGPRTAAERAGLEDNPYQ